MADHLTSDDKFYKKIFDSFSDGIIITDKDLVIRDINHSAQQLINSSRKRTLNKDLSAIFPTEITRLAVKSINDERAITKYETELGGGPLKNQVFLQVTLMPHFSSENRAEGLIIYLKHIEGTKLLSIFKDQQSFNSNFENLMLGLAHELKNPLSGIKGAAQLLTNDLSKKELSKCSHIITKEADRLIEFIDKIRENDKFSEKQFSSVNVNEIIFDILYLESKAAGNRIDFKKDLDITIPAIQGDENAIKQVFVNIIRNAVQSITGKGSITISTQWINDYKIQSRSAVLTSVEDTGEGIAKDKIDKIFTPFFTTKPSGTGLGLFISNRIVAKHGGMMFVDSVPGNGSEFRIFLPA